MLKIQTFNRGNYEIRGIRFWWTEFDIFVSSFDGFWGENFCWHEVCWWIGKIEKKEEKNIRSEEL